MQRRLFITVLLAFALAGQAAAQTPDDDASQRPCEKTAHAGFNATHGNAEALSLLVGADYCREWKGGRWSGDLDANVHRTEGRSATERFGFHLFRERHFQRDWVLSFFGSGEVDPARALDSRLLAGAGFGKLRQFPWGKGVHAGLHGGLAYTVTSEEGGKDHGFPEAWTKLDVAARLTDILTLTSAFHSFTQIEAAADTRLDAESNLSVQIHKHISLRTGVTLLYDFRPAEGADGFDFTTYSLIAFTFGKKGEPAPTVR